MTPIPKAFEEGAEEARRDIAEGRLRLQYGVAGDRGRDLKDTLLSRFGVELLELTCFVTEESNSFVAGYNTAVIAHVDGIFGAGSVAAVHQEVQQRRKKGYDEWVAANKNHTATR
jgi:hypothetical protein